MSDEPQDTVLLRLGLDRGEDALTPPTLQADHEQPTPRGQALAGPSATAGPWLGRYAISGRLGEGGIGEVLLVTDPDLGRSLAAKRLRADWAGDRRQVAKFVIEAMVTGQLEHPGIVPVHELSTAADGSPFFTMKRIQGVTLAERINKAHRRKRDGALPPAQLSDLLHSFLKVCEAIAFAHSRGVIHRDLKPANVMTGEYGEVLVVDWGLAKVAGQPERSAEGLTLAEREGQALATLDGTIVGTPAYMPPEQAEGRIDDLNQGADIYALGAILYHILTGAPPFEGDALRVLQQVSAGVLEPPSERAQVPFELEAVVLKAMAFQRSKRYRSVDDLRREVERFLAGGVLASVDYTAWQRASKFVRQHRAAFAGVAALLLLAIGLASWAYVRVTHERDAARAAERAASQQRDAALTAERAATSAGAEAAAQRDVAAKALRASEQMRRTLDQQKRRYRADLLAARARSALDQRLTHQAMAFAAAARGVMVRPATRLVDLALPRPQLSYEGTHKLAHGVPQMIARALDAWVRVEVDEPAALLASDGRALATLDYRAPSGGQITVETGGRRILIGAPGTGYRVIDVQSRRVIWSIAPNAGVYQASLAPDGQHALLARRNRTIEAVQLASGAVVHRMEGRDSMVSALCWRGVNVVAVAFSDGVLHQHQLRAQSGSALVRHGAERIRRLHSSGQWLYAIGTSGTVRCWQGSTRRGELPTRRVVQLACRHDGVMAAIDEQQRLTVWRHDGAAWHCLGGAARSRTCRSLGWFRGELSIANLERDSTSVSRWRLRDDAPPPPPQGRVCWLDSQTLVIGDSSGGLSTFALDGRRLGHLDAHPRAVVELASGHGWVASRDQDGALRWWRRAGRGLTAGPRATGDAHRAARSLAFTSARRAVFVDDRSLRAIDLGSGAERELLKLPDRPRRVLASPEAIVVTMPSGALVLSLDGQVRHRLPHGDCADACLLVGHVALLTRPTETSIYALESGERVHTLSHVTSAFELEAHGQLLLVGLSSGAVEGWDLADHQLIGSFQLASAGNTMIRWSPDGRRLAARSRLIERGRIRDVVQVLGDGALDAEVSSRLTGLVVRDDACVELPAAQLRELQRRLPHPFD